MTTEDFVPVTFGIALFGGNWTDTKLARAEETQSRHVIVPWLCRALKPQPITYSRQHKCDAPIAFNWFPKRVNKVSGCRRLPVESYPGFWMSPLLGCLVLLLVLESGWHNAWNLFCCLPPSFSKFSHANWCRQQGHTLPACFLGGVAVGTGNVYSNCLVLNTVTYHKPCGEVGWLV